MTFALVMLKLLLCVKKKYPELGNGGELSSLHLYNRHMANRLLAFACISKKRMKIIGNLIVAVISCGSTSSFLHETIYIVTCLLYYIRNDFFFFF